MHLPGEPLTVRQGSDPFFPAGRDIHKQISGALS
jgi:hypothetical protein